MPLNLGAMYRQYGVENPLARQQRQIAAQEAARQLAWQQAAAQSGLTGPTQLPPAGWQPPTEALEPSLSPIDFLSLGPGSAVAHGSGKVANAAMGGMRRKAAERVVPAVSRQARVPPGGLETRGTKAGAGERSIQPTGVSDEGAWLFNESLPARAQATIARRHGAIEKRSGGGKSSSYYDMEPYEAMIDATAGASRRARAAENLVPMETNAAERLWADRIAKLQADQLKMTRAVQAAYDRGRISREQLERYFKDTFGKQL